MVIYRSYGRLQAPAIADATMETSPREPSRVIGYHNALETDPIPFNNETTPRPPAYATAVLTPNPDLRPLDLSSNSPFSRESLPPYQCTIELESSASIKFERTNPFEIIEDTQWADVYVILRGTILSIHQLQTVGKLSKVLGSPKPDWPGRLIKQYTLQHAEVGVASDVPKHELLPRTLAAAMWPQSKIKRMQQEAPHLFDHVRQYVIRLRLECDQLLLRLRSWEARASWIDSLCMAIDIAPPLDDRTEPKYHTLPRRRRQRQPRGTEHHAHLSMTNLIEEQERIMRERFPHLLLDSGLRPTTTEIFEDADDVAADPEAEDLDSTVVLANIEPRRSQPRSHATNLIEVVDHLFETRGHVLRPTELPSLTRNSSTVHDRKYHPTTQLDRSQELRYRRRCMPALLLASRRSSDVIIRNGARWQIDWDSKVLKPYPGPPPRYELPEITSSIETQPMPPLLNVKQAMKVIPSSTTGDDRPDSFLDTVDIASSSTSRTGKSWKDSAAWSRRGKRAASRAEEDGSSSENSEIISLHKLRSEQAGTILGSETLKMLGI